MCVKLSMQMATLAPYNMVNLVFRVTAIRRAVMRCTEYTVHCTLRATRLLLIDNIAVFQRRKIVILLS